MSRTIPKELYDAVFHLIDDIVQPRNELDSMDDAKGSEALAKLRALYDQRAGAGNVDPFLTEAMADFTEDDAEAVGLYELALLQSASMPGEPLHTKHLGLAERLAAIGRSSEAAVHLEHARRGAFREGATEWMGAMDELDDQLRL